MELTAEEVAALRKSEVDNTTFGVAEETEKTYVRICSLKEIMDGGVVDWATIGILLTVIRDCGVSKVS